MSTTWRHEVINIPLTTDARTLTVVPMPDDAPTALRIGVVSSYGIWSHLRDVPLPEAVRHNDRSKPEPSELEGRAVAPTPIGPAEDSAEVERVAEMLWVKWSQGVDPKWCDLAEWTREPYLSDTRAVLADLRAQGWRSPSDLAGHILVPLEGAAQECWTEWGLQWKDELDGPGHTPESARAERDRLGVPGDAGEVVRREVTHVRTRDGDEVALYRSWQVAE